MPAADTTNALPDRNHPVIDRYRKWDPLWYRFIKPRLETTRRNNELAENTEQAVTELTTTVGENTTVITELTESVDGIHALWGVEINTNGTVTGAVQLDSTNSVSEFRVLANRFIIEHPTDTGQTIQAFIATVVDGSPAFGFNGNVIISGTVDAEALNVNTLSAISANIGNVTAGTVGSADGRLLIDCDNVRIRLGT